ncbi:MAG: cyclic nucleotide-binding domain-containing protein [Methylacidiphilales bacterium]|nr:cyclic nucleotide-binding domain-containing protein [Candidatus Methylacidiphilales bacterium]
MDAHANKFWEGFSPQGKERLLASMVLEGYPDRAYLFREGDVADGVCMVLHGHVEILIRVGSQEQILGHFDEGEFLGEVAVLDGGKRSTCARAHGPVTVGKIGKELLLEVLLEQPASVTLHLFQLLLSSLRRTNNLFVGEILHKEKLSVVGEMASSLMHDLRNPLTGIRLSADLMSLKDPENPETARCCDGIRFQCDRVMAMTRDLLRFSKGDSSLHIDRTTTTTFLERFKGLHLDYFKETELAWEITAEPAEIEIDEMRCLRLLQNLVTNAVEALAGNPDGRIKIRGWVEDSMFNLSISDNGPGIPEAIRALVFQPFVTYGKKGALAWAWRL